MKAIYVARPRLEVTEKEAQKAELEADLMGAKDLKGQKSAELMATQEYIHQLHGSCDFLVQNYDLRKEVQAEVRELVDRGEGARGGSGQLVVAKAPASWRGAVALQSINYPPPQSKFTPGTST